MPEIRIDPLSGGRTIIAGERSRRPGGVPGLSAREPALEPIDPEQDPFAEGNEDRTPPELYAIRPGGGPPDSPGWRVRAVSNLYPALDPSAPSTANPSKPSAPTRGPVELLESLPATGVHELIVNGPQPVASLAELPREQVLVAVDAWRERMRAHATSVCVQLIVNERREAGASLPHTHAQLYALDFVPAAVARERERFGAYATRTMGQNLLEDLVAEEVRLHERIVAIDDEAVLLAPYASRLPFQLMLAPRMPRLRFEDEGPSGAARDRAAARLPQRCPPRNALCRALRRSPRRKRRRTAAGRRACARSCWPACRR